MGEQATKALFVLFCRLLEAEAASHIGTALAVASASLSSLTFPARSQLFPPSLALACCLTPCVQPESKRNSKQRPAWQVVRVRTSPPFFFLLCEVPQPYIPLLFELLASLS